MRFKTKKHSMDSLFTFLLLLVFALFTLMLAAMGSAIYRNGMKHLNENYTSRTAIAYLSEKIRQHDAAGDIFLTEVEEIPSIGFRDVIEEDSFITYVYYYDGALRELFVHQGTAPLAAMGNSIVELEAFEIRELDGTSGNEIPGDYQTPENHASESGVSEDSGPRLLYVTASGYEGTSLSILIHPGSSS